MSVELNHTIIHARDNHADPHLRQPGEINDHHGGRGLYFMDPAGHGMEIITRPYGSHEQTPTAS